MLDSPIKFPSSPSSSEDVLPFHHSSEENVSSDDGMFDYSPPWSFEKEDLDEEDENNTDADVEDNDDNSDTSTPTPTPTSPCLLRSERGEHDPLCERIIYLD